ncbi:MAG: hypothetical protein JWO13_3299 [Acidobacteriales bacterium]|nr:hypothetical protein [Terriglobales bacterium]
MESAGNCWFTNTAAELRKQQISRRFAIIDGVFSIRLLRIPLSPPFFFRYFGLVEVPRLAALARDFGARLRRRANASSSNPTLSAIPFFFRLQVAS